MEPQRTHNYHCFGFTLIEMSVTLVIIGLLAGGLLAATDMKDAAAIRAQICQIEKYNTAVNGFFNKYQALPGDMQSTLASQFGFTARAGTAEDGDGDGRIGTPNSGASYGETFLFWEDLSQGGLIEGTYNTYVASSWNNNTVTLVTSPSVSAFLPQAKIGQSNFLDIVNNAGTNYIGIVSYSGSAYFHTGGTNLPVSALTPLQAAKIDAKMDDGFPQSGSILAVLANQTLNWAGGYMQPNGYLPNGIITASVASSPTRCFDNNNNSANPMQYSISAAADYGTAINCNLIFKIQSL